MSKASLIAVCRSAAWIGVLGASLLACRKDEPPPPLPPAPPMDPDMRQRLRDLGYLA